MRRALGWIAGLVGIAALGRLLSRRSRHPTAPSPTPDDPAEELRRRLAAQRGEAPFPGTGPTGGDGDPEAQEAAAGEGTLEERRARIHASTREAIDAMRTPEA